MAIATGSSLLHVGGAFSSVSGEIRSGLAAWREQTLVTGPVQGPFCAGQVVSVPFVANGTFGQANQFQVELSNSLGSFNNPLTIGTMPGTTSGTIVANLPIGTTQGSAYRLRVSSTLPMFNGVDNGQALQIDEPAVWYFDGDGDGDGDLLIDSLSCSQPQGYVDNDSLLFCGQRTPVGIFH